MLKEFKEFIAKGNVMDLAVGVIIGSAFQSIVNSLVKDVIMPFVSIFTGKVDFSNLKKVALDFSRLTGMEIHPRSPYAGNLVFTAFSGSHQDAIRKAMLARKSMPENAFWDVPYLHIDPHDIGFEYEGIIRINNQSGKGGAVYVLETDYGISAPKKMHGVIGELIKEKTNTLQKELTSQEVYDAFAEKFINTYVYFFSLLAAQQYRYSIFRALIAQR